MYKLFAENRPAVHLFFAQKGLSKSVGFSIMNIIQMTNEVRYV